MLYIAGEAPGPLALAHGERLSVGQGLEVGAGAEGLIPGARDDHRPDLRVAAGLLQRLTYPDGDCAVYGVTGLGPVEGDDHHLFTTLDEDGFAHALTASRAPASAQTLAAP